MGSIHRGAHLAVAEVTRAANAGAEHWLQFIITAKTLVSMTIEAGPCAVPRGIAETKPHSSICFSKDGPRCCNAKNYSRHLYVDLIEMKDLRLLLTIGAQRIIAQHQAFSDYFNFPSERGAGGVGQIVSALREFAD